MKKILTIGSIFSIALLTLLPLSSVIGFQNSIYSESREDTLFTIRNKMALKEEYGSISRRYIGKYSEKNLPIPDRNTNYEFMNKFVNTIRTMNDESFYELLDWLILQSHQRDSLKRFSIEKITQSLIQLRNNPIDTILIPIEKEKNNLHTYECTLFMGCPMTIGYDLTVCLILFLAFTAMAAVVFVEVRIWALLTILQGCFPS